MLASRLCRAIRLYPARRLCETLPAIWYSNNVRDKVEMSAPNPSKRSKSSSQLEEFASAQKVRDQMTTSHGVPVDNKNAVVTVGERGPMLMQDIVYMDEMAHFDRERIPERVVHAKGAGEHLTYV